MTPFLPIVGRLLTERALAIATLPIQCQGLVGCGQQPANVFLTGIPHIALMLLQIAAAGSVLAIVWAGFQMVFSWGDTGKTGQAKLAIIYSLAGLAVSVLSQFIISSVASENIYTGNPETIHLNIIAGIVRYLRNVLNAGLAIAIAYGAIKMVTSQGKQDDFTKGRTAIIWAVIGAIVVNFAASIASIASGILGV